MSLYSSLGSWKPETQAFIILWPVPESWIFSKPWQPSHSKRLFWKNIPLPWNSRSGKHFVWKLQRNRFQMLTPRVFCLSTPALQCLAGGSSTGSTALQEPRHSPTAHQHHGQSRTLETGPIQALQEGAAGHKAWVKAAAGNRRDRAKQQTTHSASSRSSKGSRGQTDRQTDSAQL